MASRVVPRFELKYEITEAQAAAIQRYAQPMLLRDTHHAQGRYWLESVYWDSPDLRLCRESLDGIKNRFKLRVRSYGHSTDSTCFIEIKRRLNTQILKSRACLSRDVAAAVLRNRRPPDNVDASTRGVLEQFLSYCREYDARPMLRVRYEREAYESRLPDGVRLTIDRNLCFAPAASSHGYPGPTAWHRLTSALVLEIKFVRAYPTWLAQLTERFSLQPMSISKYARCIRMACVRGYCAPLRKAM